MGGEDDRRGRPRFDVFDAHCPSRRLLDTIGDKWASLVIVALGLEAHMPEVDAARAAYDGVSAASG